MDGIAELLFEGLKASIVESFCNALVVLLEVDGTVVAEEIHPGQSPTCIRDTGLGGVLEELPSCID